MEIMYAVFVVWFVIIVMAIVFSAAKNKLPGKSVSYDEHPIKNSNLSSVIVLIIIGMLLLGGGAYLGIVFEEIISVIMCSIGTIILLIAVCVGVVGREKAKGKENKTDVWTRYNDDFGKKEKQRSYTQNWERAQQERMQHASCPDYEKSLNNSKDSYSPDESTLGNDALIHEMTDSKIEPINLDKLYDMDFSFSSTYDYIDIEEEIEGLKVVDKTENCNE